jgi:ubiquinone/menaquinone biosynthesis C-methylase UbiE
VSFTTGPDAYGKGVGRYSSALAEAFCNAAGVAKGDTALDVGCGPGALVAELARRVGVDRVAAVDPSAPFVAAARLRVPGADIREAAAEELPFGASSFELVLPQLVVNFTDDPRLALAEMRRVGR